MGKNKANLIEEAKKHINSSEMTNEQKSKDITALESMSKKEIQEYIDNSFEDSDENDETLVDDEANEPEATPTAEPEDVLEKPTKKKSKAKEKQIYACPKCDYKKTDKNAKCARHKTRLVPWPKR